MPELVDQMYCSQQIVIPPKFPYILKRYCKAAIKTQPYDLLRWSFEYFKALAHHLPPPVKLRLEYPIYSTEGGLTRGCLKVLANQLGGMNDVPIPTLKSAWQSFCLDTMELIRIMCLCEVHMRSDSVPFLHFLAVAGGLLTKCLTHTMILLCECLTKEPDGGSAAIPVESFITMYRFLAQMEASFDVNYINGYREGFEPKPLTIDEEESPASIVSDNSTSSDEYWEDSKHLHKLSLIDDSVTRSARLSVRLNMPILGKIERSPSTERAGQIERENYLRERKGRAVGNSEIDEKLRGMSATGFPTQETTKSDPITKDEKTVEKIDGVKINAFDEDGNEITLEFHGEPKEETQVEEEYNNEILPQTEEDKQDEADAEEDKVQIFVTECFINRAERLKDLENTFEELSTIVDKWTSANYDLGMIAGRQMSTTSGEFIVHCVEKEIMDIINEQIAILPDPDLKKKKAKPEEVQMVRDMIETFLDENMDVIVPELEEAEEEELPIPNVTVVYAVPGIGPVVDDDIIVDFEEYALDVSKVQADVFMPRNIRHFLCPPLEKYEEYKYEDTQKGEELPTGGTITD